MPFDAVDIHAGNTDLIDAAVNVAREHGATETRERILGDMLAFGAVEVLRRARRTRELEQLMPLMPGKGALQ